MLGRLYHWACDSFCKAMETLDKNRCLQMSPTLRPWLRSQCSNFCLCPRLLPGCQMWLQPVKAAGRSSEDVLPGTRLQDQRAARHPLHHRPFHQLRHRHDAGLRLARRALGAPRCGAALPAQCLTAVQPFS